MIDHQLVTDELAARLVPGSVEVLQLQEVIADYSQTTSDHLPVLARYRLDGLPPPPPPPPPEPSVVLLSPHSGQSLQAAQTVEIRWRSESVASVGLDASSDGTQWTRIASALPATGAWDWEVPQVASLRLRVCDEALADRCHDVGPLQVEGRAMLALIEPQQGAWSAGEPVAIRWSASEVSEVDLSYSVDGGMSWVAIAESISQYPDRFVWMLPSLASSRGRIRACCTLEPGLCSQSASDLTFRVPAPPRVIINEALANEPEGRVGEEYVELLNVSSQPVDLSGWTLGNWAPRHVFSPGTWLPAGQAVVVAATAAGILAGVQNALASTSGKLMLGNGGGTIVLWDADGLTHDTFAYDGSSHDGQCFNRSPDGRPLAAVDLHTSLSPLLCSPGTAADGTAFGSRPLPTTLTKENEPNGSPEEAQGEVGTGIAVLGAIEAYGLDQDWFRLTISRPGDVEISVSAIDGLTLLVAPANQPEQALLDTYFSSASLHLDAGAYLVRLESRWRDEVRRHYELEVSSAPGVVVP
ncbi:MAG: lamin tail domain-containing protein, partial [Deltaproteobacteria bacterium]|nr:lamin tail domain-containing protein [Deltaproteobacteria bacterium]